MALPLAKTENDGTPELVDLVTKRKPLPGEDALQLEHLRLSLMAQLAPSSPFEQVLADDIYNLICDALAHRSYRHALLRAGIRTFAQEILHKRMSGQIEPVLPSKEAEALSYDLVSDDPLRQDKALAELSKLEISVEEVRARAFASNAQLVTTHDAQIASIELRRRKLLQDYADLKAQAAKPVEDAVLMDRS